MKPSLQSLCYATLSARSWRQVGSRSDAAGSSMTMGAGAGAAAAGAAGARPARFSRRPPGGPPPRSAHHVSMPHRPAAQFSSRQTLWGRRITGGWACESHGRRTGSCLASDGLIKRPCSGMGGGPSGFVLHCTFRKGAMLGRASRIISAHITPACSRTSSRWRKCLARQYVHVVNRGCAHIKCDGRRPSPLVTILPPQRYSTRVLYRLPPQGVEAGR